MLPSGENVSTARKVVRVILASALLVGGVICMREIKQRGLFEQALQWVASLGPWAPLMFAVVYIVSVLLMVPASILTVGAGILWGLVTGGIYVLCSATIASILCFLIARHLARDRIAQRLQKYPKFLALDRAVAREGWKIVAMIRLAPVFPFSITSYGFGLTSVPTWQYFLASFAMIPGTLWYVYVGTLVGDLAGLTRPAAMPGWAKALIPALALAVIVYVTRFVQRALRRRTE